jgi:hypothetical protein
VTRLAAGDAVQELSGEEEEEQQQAEQQEEDAAEHGPAGSTTEAQKRARADSGVHHGDLVAATLMERHSCNQASTCLHHAV